VRKRLGILTTVVAFAVCGWAGATTPPLQVGTDFLSVSLSSWKAKVRPVALTLKLHTELICGQPRSPLVVGFPAGLSVPDAFAPGSVLVDAKPAASVAVAARRVTVTARRPGGVLCDVIGPGLVTIQFTKSAWLGNPSSPGAYTISVEHGGSTDRATVRISA
jgi:hypothetical protein